MKKFLALFVVVLFIFLGIRSGNASHVELTELVFCAEIYVNPWVQEVELEIQWVLMDLLEEYIPSFTDEGGVSLYSGSRTVSVDRSSQSYIMKCGVRGMFSVNGIISDRAVEILKSLLSLITDEIRTRSDVTTCYPIIGKIWLGWSFWEPDDVVRILEYRDGEFYGDYYKDGINTDQKWLLIGGIVVAIVVCLAYIQKKSKA